MQHEEAARGTVSHANSRQATMGLGPRPVIGQRVALTIFQKQLSRPRLELQGVNYAAIRSPLGDGEEREVSALLRPKWS